ncbi:carbohydrate-binding module family 20 domain-containing protein [Sphaerisporangium sp. TRM90804]|uniref:carbohydrate-binding module family 20 domain-containing protein n=1 Tax=Sphaerisporangium sp. TRM90804 TaxID=3031113 RepID=UPI002449C63C|nr:carbohydrate-binding module family 20 domain-containing protein [Sphaerisporangium sp. TRM90804]MDH2424922.1 carbohydrate-binding module family 20 domain-containing protein [Sphaerisporangium sp. TRM90804]
MRSYESRSSRRPEASPRLAVAALLALLLSLLAVPLTAAPAQAAPPGDKDVIANLFAWNWPSVSAECTSVLGPAGYGGVQVSPPQDSLKRSGVHSWWELYQPAAYDINGRLGTRAQFASMVQACHAAGVKVYADAVINHMTGQGATSYGGKTFSKYDYPGTYSAADFHYYPDDCGNGDNVIHDVDYGGSARNVQQCELVGLSDLDTGASYVRSRLSAYLNDLSSLGVDGFRIDAVKHMSPADLSAIYGGLSGSPYIFQEVIYGAGEAVQPSQYTGLADVMDFQYGRYLKQKFEGNISELQTFGASWGGMQPSDKAVTFVTNHDTERNGSTLTYKNGATYTLANIFQLAWTHGSPQVYDGFTFTDHDSSPPSDGNGYVTAANCSNGWTCLHRDGAINGMVGFRNAVRGTSVANWSAPTSSVIAFSRGNKGWVAINNGGGSHTGTFATGLPAGTYANLTGAGSVTVAANGTATVTVPAKAAVAIRTGGPTPPASVATSFNVNATTAWGQNVFVTGNVAELGNWSPAAAVPLSSAAYPVWRATVNLPASTAVQYKYIKKDGGGAVVWESDPNRSFTTPASGTATRNDTWR